MHTTARVLSSTVRVALSPVIFATVIFSANHATNDSAIQFAVHRLDRGDSTEVRDAQGNILICGQIDKIERGATAFTITTVKDREILRDCALENLGTKTLLYTSIGFLDVKTPHSEFYVYEQGQWAQTTWRLPIKSGNNVFAKHPDTSGLWRRYTRPPVGLPGVFWPEVRVASSAYFLTKVNDHGLAASLALDFKMHRLLYRLSTVLESTIASRLQNGNADFVSPNSYLLLQGGLSYALLNRSIFSLALSFSGGIISYATQPTTAGSQGIRPVITAGTGWFWHWRKNGVDRHKVSFFAEPRATLIVNRDEKKTSQWPWLFEMRIGVQYGY